MPAPPTAPAAAVPPTAPADPLPEPTPFPGPGVYAFAPSPGVRVQSYTSGSRYVLANDGTFVLEYPHVAYRGRYSEVGGRITFDWDGWSVAGPWGASGVFNGNSMIVRYNLIMIHSDFEDGVYVKTP